MTSLSDLEKIEKIMKSAQHANKFIVRHFGKHLEDFRREAAYQMEIILTDLTNQNVPDYMLKQTETFKVANRLSNASNS